MYLQELKLWNFRRFGQDGAFDMTKPHLTVEFKQGINVLVGENDSGKSAIVDAIKLVLKTHANEWIRVEDDDFYNDSTELRIEILLSGMTDVEASHFTEWLGWNNNEPYLRLVYGAKREKGHIIPLGVLAGVGDDPTMLNFEASEYLKVTYLKPLRDADTEMSARRNSRISQILQTHNLLQTSNGKKHELEDIFDNANDEVNKWFDDAEAKMQIHDVIDKYLKQFITQSAESEFLIANSNLRSILEKISIVVKGQKNLGLGSLNRLYMAAELLHLQKSDWTGLRLCLIEELEAHLHPQAQMKVVEALQKVEGTQFILTTHSPNITSKLKISESDKATVSLCKSGKVYPLWPERTNLKKADYCYLEHFLDVTKSNMFFAKGIILVEGWAEEILLPVIADKMGLNLTQKEVSIVNVGSTAYLHFANIFTRQDNKPVDFKVAIVTDLDVRPKEDHTFDTVKENTQLTSITSRIKETIFSNIKWCVAKHWTLEWCLYKSTILGDLFKESVKEVHSGIFDVDDATFEDNLIDRLRKFKIQDDGKPKDIKGLDKVAVAHTLAQKITECKTLDFAQDDEYIQYLKDAITHACS